MNLNLKMVLDWISENRWVAWPAVGMLAVLMLGMNGCIYFITKDSAEAYKYRTERDKVFWGQTEPKDRTQ